MKTKRFIAILENGKTLIIHCKHVSDAWQTANSKTTLFITDVKILP